MKMASVEELEELRQRVRDTTGPDWGIDRAIWTAIGAYTTGTFWRLPGDATWSSYVALPEVTASTDASLTLVEWMLPGRARLILLRAIDLAQNWWLDKPHARVWLERLPIAIIDAFLTALIEQEK